MYKWKVCPIQGRQLKDVREEDIYGDFRFCNTYRGGGGYDQFPIIAKKRGFTCDGNIGLQFVVQLFGCNLNCFYCYVTRDGVFGKYIEYSTSELVGSYYWACLKKHAGVFHLMGGAPALYLEHWGDVIDELDENTLFHSDLMLTEGEYKLKDLNRCLAPNALYAINIKGVTPKDYFRNTGKKLDEKLFWDNFDKVIDSGILFYITFTNPEKNKLDNFKEQIIRRYGDWVLLDSFVINLVEYEALQ